MRMQSEIKHVFSIGKVRSLKRASFDAIKDLKDLLSYKKEKKKVIQKSIEAGKTRTPNLQSRNLTR